MDEHTKTAKPNTEMVGYGNPPEHSRSNRPIRRSPGPPERHTQSGHGSRPDIAPEGND